MVTQMLESRLIEKQIAVVLEHRLLRQTFSDRADVNQSVLKVIQSDSQFPNTILKHRRLAL